MPNPEAGCTYYEQYCIDDDRFQLGKLGGVVGRPMYVSCDGIVISAGDFVYVRSDQDRPFIARINKMWSDAK